MYESPPASLYSLRGLNQIRRFCFQFLLRIVDPLSHQRSAGTGFSCTQICVASARRHFSGGSAVSFYRQRAPKWCAKPSVSSAPRIHQTNRFGSFAFSQSVVVAMNADVSAKQKNTNNTFLPISAFRLSCCSLIQIFVPNAHTSFDCQESIEESTAFQDDAG